MTHNINRIACLLLIATLTVGILPTPRIAYALTVPVIEAGDVTSSDSNNANDTTPDIAYPSYVAGDLLIMFMVRDDNASVTTTEPSTGPNGETLTILADGDATFGSGANRIGLIYWIGTGTETASTLAWALSGTGEQWVGFTVKVPTGEFDPDTPVDSVSSLAGQSTNQTTVPTPSWTVTNADAKVVVFMGVDADTLSGSPSGWTLIANNDDGAAVGAVTVRDAGTSASETVSSVNYTIASDTSTTLGLAVNAPPEPCEIDGNEETSPYTFSTPGSCDFIVPDDMATLDVELWGGGGGGGADNGSAGDDGGQSSFDSDIFGNGGGGGGGEGGAGGSGGTASGGDTNTSGENGETASGTSYGGAGGDAGGSGGSGGARRESPQGAGANDGSAPGGGGGGGWAGSGSVHGGGGGGGGYSTKAYTSSTLTPGSTVTVVVGAGGAGASDGTPGGDAGDGQVTISWTTGGGGPGDGTPAGQPRFLRIGTWLLLAGTFLIF